MPPQSIATNVELTDVYTLIAEFGREKLRQRGQPSAKVTSLAITQSHTEANACPVDIYPDDKKETVATISLTAFVDETSSL